MTVLGQHFLVDYFDCDPSRLADRAGLREQLLAAALKAGANIVTDVFHDFNPVGMSGVVVIAESHIAIHTWPEHGCAAVDIFSCSDSLDVNKAIACIREALGARSLREQRVERGGRPPPRPAVPEPQQPTVSDGP